MSRDLQRLLHAYRTMVTIRTFEERLRDLFAQGEIPGFVHLYAGQEACATGVCMNLHPEDHVASTHRGHGHCIAKGCDVNAMMAELHGRSTGLCHGKGGSMHIADLNRGMMGANGVVGPGTALACGAALTARSLDTGAVAVAFFGDGGMNEGTSMESMNLAAVWHLPVIFVLEDNGYAEATGSEWATAGDIGKRAEGLGLRARRVDGHDLFAVDEAAREAVSQARAGDGPSFLHLRVARYYGHYEGDSCTYRGPEEVSTLREQKDCITHFRGRVISDGAVPERALEEIDREVGGLIEAAVDYARAQPEPVPSDLHNDVYVSY